MKRKFVRIAAVLLLLLMPFVAWRLLLTHDINKRLATIRAAGLPTNGSELNGWYAAVADKHNAALVLTQAFALIKQYPDQRAGAVSRLKDKFPRDVEALSPEQFELMRGYVETNSAALTKAGEALKLSASRYPVDFTLLANTLLPHLADVVNLAFLNQCRAMLAIQSGRNEEASAALEMTLKLANTLANEPCLISQLARLKCVKLGVATLENRINAGALDPMEITNLISAFAQIDVGGSVVRGLAGERAIYATFFTLTQGEAARIFPPKADAEMEAQSKNAFPRRRAPALRLIGYYDLDLRFFLGAMETSIALAGRPYPFCLSAANQANRAGEQAKQRNYLVSGNVMNLAGAVASGAEAEAFRRMALTALSVEQYRNQHGRLPDKLEDLGQDRFSEIAEDPFTGREFVYRQGVKGYSIYSVGRDRTDDGGLEKSERKESADKQSYDLTFVVHR